MKTFIPIIISTLMLFTSCGSNQSNEKKNPTNATEQSTNEPSDTGDFEEPKNCDEYLDKYEEWMDNYIKLVEKYMKNPMDTSLSQEFMKQMQEGSLWMDQWNDKLLYCASHEKYQKRFDEISEKAEKKFEELGIE